MLKKYKGTIILTSVITLLPVIAGLILWDRLPETIATHFGADNEPNGWSSKAFTVFGIPIIMLGIHLLGIFATKTDPKSKNISDKAINIVLWIIPLTSLLVMGVTYAFALGKKISIGFAVIMFMGVIFVALGNYMPKCRQNFTFGIKIPWTLNDEENWNKTHRLAGKLFVMGGIVICATAFLENPVIFIAIILCMVFVPVIYSYTICKSKKQ